MSFDPKKTTVLLVEDTTTMRKIEIRTLKGLGFGKIIEAADGEAAIKHLQTAEAVDLIISDWNMPKKDGLELLLWVRSQERFKTIPFLMATGQGEKKQEQKAIEAGVNSFVAKPFHEDELKRKIDEAFGMGAQDAPIDRGPRETASGKAKLKVAHIQITDHIVLGVLKHMIAKGEVCPQTFELETECLGGWNPVQDALEKGAVDAAFVLAPIAVDLYSVGTPIRLALLAHKGGSVFVRNKKRPSRETHADFFKKTSFYIPHKMSVHHMLAHLFFKKIGLTSGMGGGPSFDVNFDVVAPIKMQEFLETSSAASGFMVAEPLGTRAIASGAAELQFLSNELWENHPCCVVAVRNDFIEPFTPAVFEFVDLLVQAGQLVDRRPELAAEIGVAFLDPQKTLGLRVPILKNVLTEEKGIKTGDLFPVAEDLQQMHDYMLKEMRIGAPVDMKQFVDIRFAEAAYKNRNSTCYFSKLHDRDDTAQQILQRAGEIRGKLDKTKLNLEGKYLTFTLGSQEFAVDILKIREIVGMQSVRTVPQAPDYVKGVINLRGKVIPVMDLRRRFGMGEVEAGDRTCIIITEIQTGDLRRLTGLLVDGVSDVRAIKASQIEAAPSFGSGASARCLQGVAKMDDSIKLLLDIDQILNESEVSAKAA